MKLYGWKSLFAPHILKRGERYWLEERVDCLTQQANDEITAVVEGSEDYFVRMKIRGGKVAWMECSCPYASEGDACKHEAAVLYALAEDGPEPLPEQAPHDSALRKLVEAMDEASAKKLLLELAEADSTVAQMILQSASATDSAAVPAETWQAQIRALTEHYADRDGFIDYDHAWAYVRDLEELMETGAEALLAQDAVLEAFSLVCEAFVTASEADMDDDGGLYMFFSACDAQWDDILEHGNEVQRLHMFRWFSEQFLDSDDRPGNDIIAEFMLEAFQGEDYDRMKLSALDARIAAESDLERSYSLERMVSLRMDLMQDMGLPEAEIEDYQQQFFQLPSVRKRMISRHIERGETEAAIQLLRQSKQIDEDYYGLLQSYSTQLIDLYQELQRTEALWEELWYALRTFRQDDLTLTDRLRAITPPEDWPTAREALLRLPSVRDIYCDLLIGDGLLQEAFAYIKKRGDAALAQKYEKALLPDFADALLVFHIACLDRAAERTSDRRAYAGLASQLRALARFPSGDEAARRLAQDWRIRFHRRSAMLDELRKAGF